MFRQLEDYGSLRKVSVSAPKVRESKPDLAFKAPTCENRETSFSSTRQGGSVYSAGAGLYLIFFALTVKVFREWIIIKISTKFYNLVKSFLSLNFLHEIAGVRVCSYGVFFTESHMSHKPVLSPV